MPSARTGHSRCQWAQAMYQPFVSAAGPVVGSASFQALILVIPNNRVLDSKVKRMYLKEIQMENFKSFKGKMNVPLIEGYTAITGPNGSGKSNFCIIAATSQARKGNKVIFMDTEGGFSSDRFNSLTVSLGSIEYTISIGKSDIEIKCAIKIIAASL